VGTGLKGPLHPEIKKRISTNHSFFFNAGPSLEFKANGIAESCQGSRKLFELFVSSQRGFRITLKITSQGYLLFYCAYK
jgi:hypothetical protein